MKSGFLRDDAIENDQRRGRLLVAKIEKHERPNDFPDLVAVGGRDVALQQRVVGRVFIRPKSVGQNLARPVAVFGIEQHVERSRLAASVGQTLSAVVAVAAASSELLVRDRRSTGSCGRSCASSNCGSEGCRSCPDEPV